jgi:hypothetical protein
LGSFADWVITSKSLSLRSKTTIGQCLDKKSPHMAFLAAGAAALGLVGREWLDVIWTTTRSGHGQFIAVALAERVCRRLESCPAPMIRHAMDVVWTLGLVVAVSGGPSSAPWP